MALPLGELLSEAKLRGRTRSPCRELPPQRLRGLSIGEARKMLLAKRLAFFRFDFCFGVTRGEQPLVRGSSASKSLALFWFSFGRQKRTSPPGEAFPRKPEAFPFLDKKKKR